MTVGYKSLGFTIGLDLGQRVDQTADVVCEKLLPVAPESDTSTWPSEYRVPFPEIIFVVRELGRLPLGTDYVSAARAEAEVCHNVNCADYDHAPRLFVDATGIGGPVIDSLERFLPTGVTAVRVLWTSGAKLNRVGREWHVGKGRIVSRLQALIDTGRIQVPSTPEAQALLDELTSFEIKITDSGTVVASAKSGAHDDLVMSLALCVIEDDAPRIAYHRNLTWKPQDDWADLHSSEGLW